ncbi:MAG: NAD(P)/FAD-dependent oxidoreductase [Thermoanaerobaculia bacterium]
MSLAADLAVVGSGFGGSLVALVARRLGRTVVLLERGAHPRFAIGESSSPLPNLLLESLADRYGLPRLRPLSKWGTWRRAYPQVACGLKRGFSFYRHDFDRPFVADPERRNELLVAASPRDEVADTHWYRPDFDHFLVREAEEAGAVYLDRTVLDRVEVSEDRAVLEGERAGTSVRVEARLLVDASGPRGFLWRSLRLPERKFPYLPRTCGLFTHFAGVRRLDEMGISTESAIAPYPPDDAALHHVFDGGWIWVLRFANGITSAGVAAAETLARKAGLSDGAPGWDRLLERLPTVRDQFAAAKAMLPFVYRPLLPFRAAVASGPGWTLLPSAAAFVDPLLSTGFPLTLLGVERLGRALEEDWGSRRLPARLEADGRKTLSEADTAALLIAALYASFSDFPLFVALSKLYFAAASFSEAARRLSRPELSGSFLCGDRTPFGQELRRACRKAIALGGRGAAEPGARDHLLSDIERAIEPLDVAGLTRPGRRNWYPVLAEDLLESAGKLGATRVEIERLLERTGFFAPPAGTEPDPTSRPSASPPLSRRT